MNLTPVTKRISVVSIGLIAVSTMVGFGFGSITFDQANLVIMPIVTGLFALINN